MIKKINIIMLVFAASLAISCSNDPIIYDGPATVGVITEKASLAVKEEPNQRVELTFGVASVSDQDWTIPLVITADKGAVNGTQFSCPTSVVVPAGASTASISLEGFYDELTTGTIYTIKVAVDSSVNFVMGKNICTVTMNRFCPFALGDFIGNASCVDALWPEPYLIGFIAGEGENEVIMQGFWEVTPEDEADGDTYSIPITFDPENGTFSIQPTDIDAVDVGLGIPTVLRMYGASGDFAAPITGTYNACERKLSFTYWTAINDNAAGGYNGTELGEMPVEITMQ